MRLTQFIFATLCLMLAIASRAAESDAFQYGVEAFERGNFGAAATNFSASVREEPSSGAFVNLGLAEWRRGRVGAAVVAWERALWIEPSNKAARNNLQYARQIVELPEPELTWNEAASQWLSPEAWAIAAGGSLWLAVALITMPGLLRWKKSMWQQALGAASLCVFLLSVPAHVGIVSRSNLGFVLEKRVALRLTPTDEAERIATLDAGEPVRRIGHRGKFLLVRTAHGKGWIERRDAGFVSGDH